MAVTGNFLRDLYRTLETPGANRLREARAPLDSAMNTALPPPETTPKSAPNFSKRLTFSMSARRTRG